MKIFLAVARVSSREQEREGFSLDVQVDGFEKYAESKRGKIEKMWVISETATRADERKIFREILAYAKRHHKRIDGLLFYKVDRALRNMKDLVELEELESKFGVDFISITQPMENTPTGRMMRRQLATMAAFTTEQQSLDVKDGIAKRVENGLFPSRAPYGYKNIRVNGRSIVKIHPQNGPKVLRIFEMYAYHALSVEEIINKLFDDGLFCTQSKPKLSESKVYGILRDRAYISEVKFRGNWHPGSHEPLIDMETWNRVQVLLGEKVYRSHQMLYAGALITCGQHAERVGGEIVKMFRIAETASKRDERKTFKELLEYAKKNAHRIDGLLFYKVDRAARNLFDYVDLERLESDHGIQFISVSQPTENTPAGRMQRRMLASMASFYTEQQSIDVKDGLARRVQNGLSVGKAPFGYRNYRVDGRSLVEIDPENGPKVRRIFELYAYHNHSLDTLIRALAEEGIEFSASRARFGRSKLHDILIDRAYIGEVRHKGQWYPGIHEPLVDRATWDRVQFLMGQKIYQTHRLTYGSELIQCAHCGSPITGECKTKKTKKGEKEYVYYRCVRYHKGDHPRIRMTEAEFDEQMLGLFDSLRVESDEFREEFREGLRSLTNEELRLAALQDDEIQQAYTRTTEQQSQLLDLRLDEEIDSETFAAKATELRDKAASMLLHLEKVGRGRFEIIDIAVKAFELSQTLRSKWVEADYAAKRRILEIVCLNFSLDDITLVATMRKPFDMLAEGLVWKNSRGDWI